MIAPIALLDTPLTTGTFLRRLREHLLGCCFFLFLDVFVRSTSESEKLTLTFEGEIVRVTCNHTPGTSRPYATAHYAPRSDSSCSAYTGT